MKYMMLLLAIGLLAVPVFAQDAMNETGEADQGANVTSDETLEVNESEVGALPDDFFYGFKRFFENVDKFFTLDKSESAKKHAKYGKLRAIEAHLMTKKAQEYQAMNRTEAKARALEIVEGLIAESAQEQEVAQTELEQAVEDGSANETEVEEVQNYTRNSIIVLQRVYEKAPEAAKDGLLRALNNSIANYEKHVEKMESKNKTKVDDSGEENETEVETETEENETGTSGKGKPEGAGKPESTGKPETAGKPEGKGAKGGDSDDGASDDSEDEDESEDEQEEEDTEEESEDV